MKTIWEKSDQSHENRQWFNDFTTSEDRKYDQLLVRYDILVNLAHARTLLDASVLDDASCDQICKTLISLYDDGIVLTPEDEDVHSAIEKKLIGLIGETGKKIHTARSRNDQVLADIKLYAKEVIRTLFTGVFDILSELDIIRNRDGKIWFAGTTHSQPAMPATVAGWVAAWQYVIIQDLHSLKMAYEITDMCPLGSAAGYGTPYFQLNRKLTSDLLGFSQVQNPVMATQLFRGAGESRVTDALGYLMHSYNRMASDLIWMYHPSQGFISLSSEQTSGSSVMPQKRNPDALELIRGAYHEVNAFSISLKTISAGLISGYHRDLQYVKKYLIESMLLAKKVTDVFLPVLRGIRFNKDFCTRSLTPEIFATHMANKKVKEGMAFRDAYLIAAHSPEQINTENIQEFLASYKTPGDPANYISADYSDLTEWHRIENDTFRRCIENLLKT